MSADPHVVYVTVPEMLDAARIAREAVSARLAACANIMPNIQSVYHWDGEVCLSDEVIIVFKTTGDRVIELTHKVIDEHPDEVPCVTSWPITDGNPEYLKWVRDEATGVPQD